MPPYDLPDDSHALLPVSAAHARLREVLSKRPGWRAAQPQFLAASGEWRASAYDSRRSGRGPERLSATGETAEQAVSKLAELLAASVD